MKRQFGTLLAVTLAAAPAAASPHRASAPPPPSVPAPAPAPTSTPAPAPTSPPPITRPAGPPAPSFMQQLVNSFAMAARTAARPRELRCGAPACGNVTSRLAPGRR